MKCVVKNCSNEQKDKNAKKTFFHFPQDEKLAKKWIKFCKNKQPFKQKTWRICIDHFNEDDICGNGMYEMGFAVRRTLKAGAIPCRYTDTAGSESTRKERSKRRENKKIVDSLLMNVDEPVNKIEPLVPAIKIEPPQFTSCGYIDESVVEEGVEFPNDSNKDSAQNSIFEEASENKDCAQNSIFEEASENKDCAQNSIRLVAEQEEKIKLLQEQVTLLKVENEKLKYALQRTTKILIVTKSSEKN